MAEFDNFRKRTIKEKAQMYESGAKEVLDKLLPVVDNFERAFDAATDDHKEDPFVKGIDMIYKQVMAMLDDLGVEEIEALGEEFDPNLHHAVQHEASEDHDDNTVVDVFQKGYMYKDTVLRYSMVKVVN
jgi:molecular chaperone GrpE